MWLADQGSIALELPDNAIDRRYRKAKVFRKLILALLRIFRDKAEDLKFAKQWCRLEKIKSGI